MMKTLALSLLILGMMGMATYQEMNGINPVLIYVGIAIALFGAIYADDKPKPATYKCECQCQHNDPLSKD